MVAALRAIFVVYVSLMLVWFVPSHQRGAIVLGQKSPERSAASSESHGCCAVKPAPEPVSKPCEPTDSDRKACFVCFWVAGLIVVEPFTLQMEFREVLYTAALQYDAQVRAVADRLNHYGRDPPAC